MKQIVLLFSLFVISVALAACASMDSTGGFDHGSSTMDGKPVYDPGEVP